jgi:hypothetical protein
VQPGVLVLVAEAGEVVEVHERRVYPTAPGDETAQASSFSSSQSPAMTSASSRSTS